MRSRCCICEDKTPPLFCFPKKEEKFKKWLEIIRKHTGMELNKNINNYYNTRICKLHFEEWCFTSSERKRLISGALPFVQICPLTQMS